MYSEFVYFGYSFKQIDIFLKKKTAEKLLDRKIDFQYDKQHFTIQCERFKLVGVPIYISTIYNLGIENADYFVMETAYPRHEVSTKEYWRISDRVDYISTRFRKTPKEKSEKELEELLDILIEV